jgi:inositol-pentakisphosphate 2-kinase
MIKCRLASLPEEHEDNVVFHFVNSGAANALFGISPDPLAFVFVREGKILPLSQLQHKVIRISKGKPKTLTCSQIIDGLDRAIRPLFQPNFLAPPFLPKSQSSEKSFEHYLMEHELVDLSSDVMRALVQQTDPPLQYSGADAQDVAPPELRMGLLLPDLSHTPGKSITLELKPKWLAQSPNAPKSPYRCRTCALHSRRLFTHPKTTPPPYICPLQLVTGNRRLITRFVKKKIKHDANVPSDIDLDSVVERAVAYLVDGPGHELLLYLRGLQQQLDPDGVLLVPTEADMESRRPVENGALGRGKSPGRYTECKRAASLRQNLRLAMTLRDCSLLLRIPLATGDGEVEAKLVDLDFKSFDKMDDWVSKEKQLLQGGWYTDLEKGVHGCWFADGWRKYCPRYM